LGGLDRTLFVIGLLIYLMTRFIALEDYPIYFFTDEAVQTVRAADFIRDGFRGYDGVLLPTFFQNNGLYILGTSVYAQVLPYLLFGKSVFVTRAVPAFISLLAAVWIGWLMRDVFKSQYWWVSPLLLSATPIWFLHSRTAFEHSLLVTFYAGFLYFYYLYRVKNPKYLYLALVMGALAFYSYMPGQIILVTSGILLLIVDSRYHCRNWSNSLKGAGVLLVVALPLIRFLVEHPTEFVDRLASYGSYLIGSTTVSHKIAQYFLEYVSGLNPYYWFFPHNEGLVRHYMHGYGHIYWALFPVFLMGLLVLVKRHVRDAKAHPVLIALLSAPSGAAVIELGANRAMVIVIPVVILSVLGIEAVLQSLQARRAVSTLAVSMGLFMAMALFNLHMLNDALKNGPFWSNEYGLYGMQYGAQAVFGEITDYLEADSEVEIHLSPSWANGTDVMARFFLPDPLPVQLVSIDSFITEIHEITDDHVFIMLVDEYHLAVESGMFADLRVEKEIPYPDGTTGFMFVRLRYVDNVHEIYAARHGKRWTPVSEVVEVDGVMESVSYSPLDMGSVRDLFDGDPNTLIRTLEANPLVVTIEFSEPRRLEAVALRIGGNPSNVRVTVESPEDGHPVTLAEAFEGVPDPRTVELSFEAILAMSVALELENTVDAGRAAHVHLWELTLR